MPLSREELLFAAEENPEALMHLFAQHLPKATYHRDEHMRRMCFQVPVPFFNGIAMAKLTVENADEAIYEAIAAMNGHGYPWSWQVAPSTTPFDMATRLFNQGMMHSFDMPLMVADLNRWKPSPLPDGYRTVPVEDSKLYEEWGRLAETAFGLPKSVFEVIRGAQDAIGFAEDATIQNFVGLANDEPVCCGTVFYSNGIGGIYTIGTPEEFRGKGYGTAITEACMSDIVARGLDTAFLQASRMGYAVYQKIGFEEICKLSIFVPADS